MHPLTPNAVLPNSSTHPPIHPNAAFPVYLHYRLTEAVMRARGLDQEEQNVVWDKLHNKHANAMLTMVKRLKGYYVKICQFSSSRLGTCMRCNGQSYASTHPPTYLR